MWRKLVARAGNKTPLGRVLKRELLLLDWDLKLPNKNYVALQKIQNDLVGEGGHDTALDGSQAILIIGLHIHNPQFAPEIAPALRCL